MRRRIEKPGNEDNKTLRKELFLTLDIFFP
jgi:hypothetical protein